MSDIIALQNSRRIEELEHQVETLSRHLFMLAGAVEDLYPKNMDGSESWWQLKRELQEKFGEELP